MFAEADNTGSRCRQRSVCSLLELATNYFIRIMGVALEPPRSTAAALYGKKQTVLRCGL
jgi:hypothetical protein